MASGLLWLIMAALLPAPISGAAVLALMVGAGVLAAGWGEAWLIRRLWRGRPISRIQWRILVGSVEHIDPRTQVWVVPGSGVCAYPVGRRSVMVSSGLLDELVAGILPHQVATALIVGAQAPWFGEYLGRNGNFSDVVQVAGDAQPLLPLSVVAHLGADDLGVAGP